VKDYTIYGADDAKTCTESRARGDWVPPGIEHVILPSSENMFESVSCYPAGLQVNMVHDMLEDKLLLGGASITYFIIV